MTIESELHRISDQLEALLHRIDRLMQPPETVHRESGEIDFIPSTGLLQAMPRATTSGVDASQAFLSGQWKRRDGHGIQPAPTPFEQLKYGPVDPWVRPDIIIPTKEANNGEATITESQRREDSPGDTA